MSFSESSSPLLSSTAHPRASPRPRGRGASWRPFKGLLAAASGGRTSRQQVSCRRSRWVKEKENLCEQSFFFFFRKERKNSQRKLSFSSASPSLRQRYSTPCLPRRLLAPPRAHQTSTAGPSSPCRLQFRKRLRPGKVFHPPKKKVKRLGAINNENPFRSPSLSFSLALARSLSPNPNHAPAGPTGTITQSRRPSATG